jgi:serine/threonine-protein kinase RsbW/stage II sporulation protein AB (anti-sigma F factor)
VVVHAYGEGEGPMEIAASVDDTVLRVTVRDEGLGIVPRPDSPGLGLGLPLIATLTESLELGKTPDDRTEVTMVFRLDEHVQVPA